jgi:hypothetical protein
MSLTLHCWHTVPLLAEALCYKPEGREFDSQRVMELFIDLNLPAPLWS